MPDEIKSPIQSIPISEPLSHLPIGNKLYQVAQISSEVFRAHRTDHQVLSQSGGKPLNGEIAKAYASIARALVVGSNPELTDEFITSWLSPALCVLIANEWIRQFVAMQNYPRA